jgi:hypothetical protein
LAADRTVLAAERTYAAWVRTAWPRSPPASVREPSRQDRAQLADRHHGKRADHVFGFLLRRSSLAADEQVSPPRPDFGRKAAVNLMPGVLHHGSKPAPIDRREMTVFYCAGL